MGRWRHLGDGLELASLPPPDCTAFAAGPRRSGAALQGPLAQLIEGEILPRLLLVHREAPAPRPRTAARQPTPDEIARFAALLLVEDAAAAPDALRALLDEGLTLETLLLHLLAPAARHLGLLWEEDACDFVEVTLAIGRLQTLTRDLCARLEEAGPEGGRSVLLMPCPGETHLFGLMLAGSFFREAGWHVTTAGPCPGLDPCDLVREEWFDVIGLSLSCEVLLPALAEAVRALRAASRNRFVRFVVGGAHFARVPDHARLVGADACAGDGRIAPALAESLLEIRSRAC